MFHVANEYYFPCIHHVRRQMTMPFHYIGHPRQSTTMDSLWSENQACLHYLQGNVSVLPSKTKQCVIAEKDMLAGLNL